MALATRDDVAPYLKVAAGALPDGIDRLLELASAVITREFPKIADEPSTPVVATTACAQMVARVLRNPAGVAQHQLLGFTEQFSGEGARAVMLLTEEEREWLSPWADSGAGTVVVIPRCPRP